MTPSSGIRILDEAVVGGDPDDGSDERLRRGFPEAALLLTRTNEVEEEPQDRREVPLPVLSGERMALEARVQHEAQEFGVATVLLHDLVDDRADDPVIVAGRRHRSKGIDEGIGTRFRGLALEDGGVEVVLVGEEAEDDGLVHAGGPGNFAGCGAAEAVSGEQARGRIDELPPTLVRGKAGRRSRRISRHK